MTYQAKPLCCYCGKPVNDGAYDGESSSWFSYGSTCMLDHREGRFVVERHSHGASSVMRRFATLRRAQEVAAEYARWNPQLKDQVRWVAADEGTGATATCED